MSITTTRIEEIRASVKTISFAASGRAASICQSIQGLVDVTYEVGLYSRQSFRGPAALFSSVRAQLVTARRGMKGREKASVTAAINRIVSVEHQIQDENFRNSYLNMRKSLTSKKAKTELFVAYKAECLERYASRK